MAQRRFIEVNRESESTIFCVKQASIKLISAHFSNFPRNTQFLCIPRANNGQSNEIIFRLSERATGSWQLLSQYRQGRVEKKKLAFPSLGISDGCAGVKFHVVFYILRALSWVLMSI